MTPPCVFCDIVQGHKNGYKVFEDEQFIAILDYRPVFFGHSLFLPKVHIETLADLPAAMVQAYFSGVQKMSMAMEAIGLGQGSFVAINNRISQSVPHLHTHIIPRNKGDGLKGFFWPRQKYGSEDEIMAIQKKLQQILKGKKP